MSVSCIISTFLDLKDAKKKYINKSITGKGKMFQRSCGNSFASISFVISRTCCGVVWNGNVCVWRIVTVGALWRFHCIFPSPQWNLDITKGPRDLQNVLDKVRFCYIEVLFLTFCSYWGEEFCCINNFVIR